MITGFRACGVWAALADAAIGALALGIAPVLAVLVRCGGSASEAGLCDNRLGTGTGTGHDGGARSDEAAAGALTGPAVDSAAGRKSTARDR